jgi:urease accessory protein
MVRLFAFSVTGIVIGGPAFAHTGVGDTAGFVHGFIHPIGGLDHVLAMVAVGLFAALLGGRALWLVPFSFVSMMAVGGALGMGGVALPFAEFGIGLSVVAFGVAVAFRLHMPIAVAMALVGFFAVFHGHAHGAEMPDTASGFEYAPVSCSPRPVFTLAASAWGSRSEYSQNTAHDGLPKLWAQQWRRRASASCQP